MAYSQEEIRIKLESILGKSLEEFSDEEKALFTDVCTDAAIGRYPVILNKSKDQIQQYFDWLASDNKRGNIGRVRYGELSIPERWAYEDLYFNKVIQWF